MSCFPLVAVIFLKKILAFSSVTVICLSMDLCVNTNWVQWHFGFVHRYVSSNFGKFWYLVKYCACHFYLLFLLALLLHIYWYTLFYKALRPSTIFIQSFSKFFNLILLLIYFHECSTFFLFVYTFSPHVVWI